MVKFHKFFEKLRTKNFDENVFHQANNPAKSNMNIWKLENPNKLKNLLVHFFFFELKLIKLKKE